MNLIPLSEYVLQEETKIIDHLDKEMSNGNDIRAILNFSKKVRNYTKFLRQPLTLGMFVPCFDDECHIVSNVVTDSNYFGIHIYEKAKEKVLFEGFETAGGIAVAKSICMTFDFIEDLTTKKHSLKELPLTPSALKLIGEKE